MNSFKNNLSNPINFTKIQKYNSINNTDPLEWQQILVQINFGLLLSEDVSTIFHQISLVEQLLSLGFPPNRFPPPIYNQIIKVSKQYINTHPVISSIVLSILTYITLLPDEEIITYLNISLIPFFFDVLCYDKRIEDICTALDALFNLIDEKELTCSKIHEIHELFQGPLFLFQQFRDNPTRFQTALLIPESDQYQPINFTSLITSILNLLSRVYSHFECTDEQSLQINECINFFIDGDDNPEKISTIRFLYDVSFYQSSRLLQCFKNQDIISTLISNINLCPNYVIGTLNNFCIADTELIQLIASNPTLYSIINLPIMKISSQEEVINLNSFQNPIESRRNYFYLLSTLAPMIPQNYRIPLLDVAFNLINIVTLQEKQAIVSFIGQMIKYGNTVEIDKVFHSGLVHVLFEIIQVPDEDESLISINMLLDGLLNMFQSLFERNIDIDEDLQNTILDMIENANDTYEDKCILKKVNYFAQILQNRKI